jgi:signal transduction histidine kinase
MNKVDHLAERAGIAIRVATNVGLGVVFLAALAVSARTIADYHGNWAFDLAVGVVVCLAALARERSRTWAAAAGLAVAGAAELAAWRWEQLPGQPGGATALALPVLIGSAVRVLPPRQVAAIAIGGAVVVVGSIERYLSFISDSTPVTFAAIWITGLGWGAALGVGLWLRLLDVRHQAAIEAVRHGERLELARELHDAAAHHITGIVLQAQAARIAARKHAETLDDALAGIEAAGTEALTSMRRVIGLLRNADDAGGLTTSPEQLTDLMERFAGRGPALRLSLPDGPADPAWPPEVTTTVYRVVQEALTNITRHAPGAREVTVALAHDQQAITVEVTDDAPSAGSPRLPHASGYGLVGMRERVEALGGTLRAGPEPGAGWSVLATLPAPGRP